MHRKFRTREMERFAAGDFVKSFSGFSTQADRRLDILLAARSLNDLASLRSNNLERLHGNREGQWSIRINRQYRICFEWPDDDTGAVEIEIVDYHRQKGTLMTRRERHPTHPGEVLAEELEARGMTGAALARALDIPQNRVSELLNGKRSVTVDTALRLARWIGSSPEFWLNLQQRYDLVTTQQRIGDQIERSVTPADPMPAPTTA